jgi:hypothetical protein
VTDPVALSAILNGIVAVASAALLVAVLRAAEGRTVNHALGIYLFLVCINAIASAIALAPDDWTSFNAYLWELCSAPLLTGAYLIFMGQALRTPLSRPFASRVAVVIIAMASLGASYAFYAIAPTGYIHAGPQLWIPRVIERWNDWGSLLIDLEAIGFVYAFVASLHAYRTAPASSKRRIQAKAYLVAFGIQDGGLALLFFVFPMIPTGLWNPLGGVIALIQLVSLTLLALALLKFQLFDFDLKVKWTLKRGTLVAIILGAFFVATAVAEQYLQGYGFVVGGVAIGLLLFALRPIERAIDRMADRAMPRTTGTPEYLAARKHEIYRAALEDSLADGAVTAKERTVLVRLANNLELDGNDAMRIEAEVLAKREAPA